MRKNKSIYLKVKDHSVTGEMFELRHDSENDMLETYPQPSKESLPKYYKSEDYISHTDTKRNLFEWAYHLVRKTTLKSKLSLLETFNIDAKNLLDVGCGTGDFLLAAKNNDWNISGVEPDEKAREIANEKTNNSVYGIEKLLNFDKHSFDVITLWHVLEHLPELEENISVFKSLLKPNGRLVIAVPNFKSYDAIFYKENWAAFDAPRHLWHFSQTSIKKMFGKIKMEIEQTLPLKFDAYYVSLLSEKYKTGWMNFIRAYFVGARSNMKARFSGEYSSLIYVVKNC